MLPRISVVILTLNEARNITDCLQALATQDNHGFEVIVVDAASTDDTVARVRALQNSFPVPLRIEASPHRLPIGEARNLGVALADHPAIAFMSADVEPRPDWISRARHHLQHYAMVFGRQLHAPQHWTVAASVRGLRYNFPSSPVANPLPLCSNVASAFDRHILTAHPFEPNADAAEDLLLALRAAADGHQATYDPDLIVRHHDIQTMSEELRKVRREGRAWGRHHHELGPLPALLAWAAALVLAAPFVRLAPRILGPAYTGILWAPAMRRARRRRHTMPADALLAGTLASPTYDLAFLLNYLRGRANPDAPPRPGLAPRPTPPPPHPSTHPRPTSSPPPPQPSTQTSTPPSTPSSTQASAPPSTPPYAPSSTPPSTSPSAHPTSQTDQETTT